MKCPECDGEGFVWGVEVEIREECEMCDGCTECEESLLGAYLIWEYAQCYGCICDEFEDEFEDE